jgi:hypothetical protein
VAWSNATVGDSSTWHDADISTTSTVQWTEAVYVNRIDLEVIGSNQPRLKASGTTDPIHIGAGGFHLTSDTSGGRMQWEGDIVLEADQTWSIANVWDMRAYDIALDFQGNTLTLTGDKNWGWRNTAFTASDAILRLGDGTVMSFDNGVNADIGGLFVWDSGAGDYVQVEGSSEGITYDSTESWLGGGTVTVYDVPEPATMGLLSLGGLVLLRRRRR